MDFYQSLVRIEPVTEGLLLTELLDREYIIMFGLGVFLSMPIKDSLQKIRNRFSPSLSAIIEYPVMAFYLLLFVLSAMSIAASTYNPFIYFRF